MQFLEWQQIAYWVENNGFTGRGIDHTVSGLVCKLYHCNLHSLLGKTFIVVCRTLLTATKCPAFTEICALVVENKVSVHILTQATTMFKYKDDQILHYLANCLFLPQPWVNGLPLRLDRQKLCPSKLKKSPCGCWLSELIARHTRLFPSAPSCLAAMTLHTDYMLYWPQIPRTKQIA